MAVSQATKKELYVFDSALPELQKLLDGIGSDQWVVILDAGSDGVLQLADALSGASGLDAIHIFSHGMTGGFWLGSAMLDQASLPSYSVPLAQIGEALSASGDLLLYGCDVAQGESGQAFIEQLARATGADVAASTDLTGDPACGANWVLEAASGTVEAPVAEPALAYPATLSATSSAVNFVTTGQSLWGISGPTAFKHVFEQLVFTPADIGSSGRASTGFPLTDATLALDYALSATNMRFGLPIEVGLSLGVFDLNYAVNATVVTPNTVLAGDSFNIATTYSAGTVAQTTLNIDGPSANLNAKLVAEADISGHLGLEWSDVPFIDDDRLVVFGDGLAGDGYSDSTLPLAANYSLLDIDNLDALSRGIVLNNNMTWSDSTLGGRTVFRNPLASFGFKFEPNAFDGAAQVSYGDDRLFDFSTVLMQDDPMLSFDIDVDDTVGYFLEKLPPTAALGQTIRKLDHEYRANYNVFGYDIRSEYDASLLSINLTVGLSPALKVEFDVTDVLMTLSTSDGQTKSGHLGDLFSFDTDASAIAPITVTASYELLGDMKVSFGLVGTIGLGLKAVGVEGQVFNLNIPAVFPDSSSDDDEDPEYYLYDGSIELFRHEWFPEISSFASNVAIAKAGTSYGINLGQVTDQVGAISNSTSPAALSVAVVGSDANSQHQYVINEGNVGDQSVIFRVTRSGNSSSSITATYSFSQGTGLDQNDFANATLPSGGTIDFDAYESSKDIVVWIHGDTQTEVDEKLTLNLSSSAQVLTPTTTLVLYSDDGYLVPVGVEMLGTGRGDLMIAGAQTALVLGMAGNDTIDASAAGSLVVDGGSAEA